MSNILFLGPATQDGWGRASLKYLKALTSTNLNITFRQVYTSFSAQLSDPLISELENNRFDHYDAVIFHLLPYYYIVDSKYGKNVGLCPLETSHWQNGWQNKMNMMDDMWVTAESNRRTAYESGVKLAKTIPEPCDPDVYNKEYPRLDKNIIDDKVVFLWMGEYIQRKNLDSVIRAFHLEFHPSEPVELIIKTNLGGMNPNDLAEKVEYDIIQIKEELGLYPLDFYRQEIISTERLSDEEIMGLHQSCDVFIQSSSAEGFAIPCFDSWGFGNYIISTATGCIDEVSGSCMIHMGHSPNCDGVAVIQGQIDSVNLHPSKRPYKDLFTPHEKWIIPNVNSIRSEMREAFLEVQNRKKVKFERPNISKYSYENIGKMMKGALNL